MISILIDIFMYIYIYIYIYIFIYIYTNLPVKVIVGGLLHPWCGNSQDQETLLAPSADNQTRNFDTECSSHDEMVAR